MKEKNNNFYSQSSPSTNFIKHVDNNLNQQFKFSKGNIALGITPKLVLGVNKITQVPLTEPSSLWGPSNRKIKTSSDSEWRTMLKIHDTSSIKSSTSCPYGSTFNAKALTNYSSLKLQHFGLEQLIQKIDTIHKFINNKDFKHLLTIIIDSFQLASDISTPILENKK